MQEIHINWYGPYSLLEVYELENTQTDFGIYQIYGSHTIYGSNVLLYVGKAVLQTFGVRIRQESWEGNKDSGNIEVYVGRLGKSSQCSIEEWQSQITKAENLILYACAPARNSSNIVSLRQGHEHIHIFNWGQYRDLLPEISGKRYSSFYSYEDFL